MSDLKIGDEIFVSNYNHDDIEARQREKRIFIKHGKNNGVICVRSDSEEEYADGIKFSVHFWRYWKRIPKKKYIPFTWEDRDKLKGRWVKEKKKDIGGVGEKILILSVCKDGVSLGGLFWGYEKLLEKKNGIGTAPTDPDFYCNCCNSSRSAIPNNQNCFPYEDVYELFQRISTSQLN